MRKNTLLAELASLLCFLTLLGCSTVPEPPMRIGTDSWPGSAPLHLARRIGSLDDRFRLVDFPTTSESVRSFRNGALEGACLTLDEAIRMLRDGMDPVIVLMLDESSGGDALVVREGIQSIGDLKGKRIGVELGAGGSYFLVRSLAQAGLTVNDVTLLYLPADKHLESIRSGDVDAVITYEPARSRLLNAGATDLFNSAKTPSEVVDVLITHGEYARRYPDRIKDLRKAWFSALAYWQKKPDEAMEIMARRLQFSPQQLETSLKTVHIPDQAEAHTRLGGANPSLKDSAHKLMASMKQSSLLKSDLDVGSLFSIPLD
jgi:NitT/TauT family transport system substrate-binding protein